MGMMNNDTASSVAPWLVADIGGTNVRFALMSGKGRLLGDIGYLRCADFPGPEAAAMAFLRRAGGAHPKVAAFAIAAAIDAAGGEVKVTNSAWGFSREQARLALGLDHLLLINDFEALALSLPTLAADQYRVVFGPAPARTRVPMAVIGPGTGLGVGVIVPNGRGWNPVAGEGGHATLAPTDDFESAVLQAVRRQFAHVSAERLLSGIGLPTLYRAVAKVTGKAPKAAEPDRITEQAREGDGLARQTLDVFCGLLGSFAGNVALTVGARGGVYIGGGIVPKLGALFAASPFRERFEAKGRFRAYLETIPTPLLTAPDVALLGAGNAIAAFLAEA